MTDYTTQDYINLDCQICFMSIGNICKPQCEDLEIDSDELMTICNDCFTRLKKQEDKQT